MSIKGQGHSSTLAQVHSDLTINTYFFSDTHGSFRTFHVKAYGGKEMIYFKK